MVEYVDALMRLKGGKKLRIKTLQSLYRSKCIDARGVVRERGQLLIARWWGIKLNSHGQLVWYPKARRV